MTLAIYYIVEIVLFVFVRTKVRESELDNFTKTKIQDMNTFWCKYSCISRTLDSVDRSLYVKLQIIKINY